MTKKSHYLVLLAILLISHYGFAEKYIFVSPEDKIPESFTLPVETVQRSLEKVHAYIKSNLFDKEGNLQDNITVFIRGGEYKESLLLWSATSAEKSVKITAYESEKPVFNGLKEEGALSENFFTIANAFKPTNITIEGLTIKNYLNAISLGTSNRCEDCSYTELSNNSHNKIINNTFTNIGNAFSNKFQNSYSVIGIHSSTDNIIEGNNFYKIENDKIDERGERTRILIHAIYLAHYSSRNWIKDNYVAYCSGDPFRIRNASNDNLFERNYVYRSGYAAFAATWYNNGGYDKTNNCNIYEKPSTGTVIRNNVYTFPYLDTKQEIFIFRSIVGDSSYEDGGHNFTLGLTPKFKSIDEHLTH